MSGGGLYKPVDRAASTGGQMAQCAPHGAPFQGHTSSPSTSTARSSTGRRASSTPSRRRPRATASRSRSATRSSPCFHEYEREIEGGSYELYAEVLRRAAVRDRQGASAGRSSPRAPASCPTRCSAGRRSRRPTRSSTKFAKKFQTGLISNIDDKLLGQTRRHIPHDFDLVVTAQQVRSYKPDPAHFKECARRIGGKKGWVHVAASYYHDVEPCLKEKVPVIWVNRNKEELEPGAEEADGRGQDPPRGGQAARRGVGARAHAASSALHADVLVATSRDLADDLHGRPPRRRGVRRRLAGLPGRARGAARRPRAGRLVAVSGLLATHGDWDHLLGRARLPRTRRSAWPRRPPRG